MSLSGCHQSTCTFRNQQFKPMPISLCPSHSESPPLQLHQHKQSSIDKAQSSIHFGTIIVPLCCLRHPSIQSQRVRDLRFSLSHAPQSPAMPLRTLYDTAEPIHHHHHFYPWQPHITRALGTYRSSSTTAPPRL